MKIGSVIRSATERLSSLCHQTINVDLKTDFSVAASSGHLDQLITNLLSNACKFSPEDSTIDILVDANRVAIVDRGPGIPPDVFERIGEPFNIGESRSTRRTKGNGLGLAWVKTVCKLYGWQLEVQTAMTGTEISISFPHIN